VHVIFNGEEHAAHVAIICCGALCVVLVVYNETEWQEVYLVSVHISLCTTCSCVRYEEKWMASQMTVNMNFVSILGSVYSYSVRDYRERCWDIVTQGKI
jgi:hypothetical protein